MGLSPVPVPVLEQVGIPSVRTRRQCCSTLNRHRPAAGGFRWLDRLLSLARKLARTSADRLVGQLGGQSGGQSGGRLGTEMAPTRLWVPGRGHESEFPSMDGLSALPLLRRAESVELPATCHPPAATCHHLPCRSPDDAPIQEDGGAPPAQTQPPVAGSTVPPCPQSTGTHAQAVDPGDNDPGLNVAPVSQVQVTEFRYGFAVSLVGTGLPCSPQADWLQNLPLQNRPDAMQAQLWPSEDRTP